MDVKSIITTIKSNWQIILGFTAAGIVAGFIFGATVGGAIVKAILK